MINLFFDTNVVIDYLINREPFATDAAFLFELVEQSKINIFISAVSYNTIYFLVRKQIGHAATIKLLEELSELVTILDVTSEMIKSALISDNTDFEDAIQYYCAISQPTINAIVTRDIKGFKKSRLPLLNAGEALLWIATNP